MIYLGLVPYSLLPSVVLDTDAFGAEVHVFSFCGSFGCSLHVIGYAVIWYIQGGWSGVMPLPYPKAHVIVVTHPLWTWALGYGNGTTPLQPPLIYQMFTYQATVTLAWVNWEH